MESKSVQEFPTGIPGGPTGDTPISPPLGEFLVVLPNTPTFVAKNLVLGSPRLNFRNLESPWTPCIKKP